MDVSIELTLTPLQNDYEAHIKAFIKRLRSSGFKVMENPLSTQIYGDYNTLMPFLIQEIKTSFENQIASILNMKIVKSDRSHYKPSF